MILAVEYCSPRRRRVPDPRRSGAVPSLRLACAALALAGGLFSAQAGAFSLGISARNVDATGPNSCSGCHTGGAYLSDIRIFPPGNPTVVRGAVRTLSVDVGTDGPFAGFNLGADGGRLDIVVGEGTRLTDQNDAVAGQLTHATVARAAPSVSWQFTWTAPGQPGTYTLSGCALPVDGERVDGAQTVTGDGPTVCATKTITVNAPPAFDSAAPASTPEDAPFDYLVVVSDADPGDTLTVTAPTLPDWLTLSADADDVRLQGTPTNDEVGVHRVVLEVSDGRESAQQAFDLTVVNTNDPPAFDTEPPAGIQRGTYRYDPIRVSDPDADDPPAQLTVTFTGLDWLSLTNNGDGTWALAGTPTAAHFGGPFRNVLRVTDGDGAFAEREFFLTVESEPPVFTTQPVERAVEGQAYRYEIGVTDPDPGDRLEIGAIGPAWLRLTLGAEGTAVLSGQPGVADIGEHPVVLTVTDSAGLSVEQRFVVTVIDGNLPPVAVAGPDRSVRPGAAFALPSADSYDPDGEIVSLIWTQLAGSPVLDAFSAVLAAPRLTAPAAVPGGEALVFELTVTDNEGRSASDRVIVNVTDANLAPRADAGPDRTVILATDPGSSVTVTLDGGGSFDPDGSIAGYAWSQRSGRTVSLVGADTAIAEFTADAPGQFEFVLVVTDDGGLQASDRVLIAVSDTHLAPSVSIDGPLEPAEEGTTVSLRAEASADGGATIESLRWRQRAGPPLTLSSAVADAVTLVVPPIAAMTEIEIELTATDSDGFSASATLTVAAIDNAIAGYPDDAYTFIAVDDEGDEHKLGLQVGGSAGALVSLLSDGANIPLAGIQRPAQMPFGLAEFRFRGEVGGAVELTALFPQAVPPGFGYFLFDPALGWIDASGSNAVLAGASVADPTRLQMTVVDGGAGDKDGAADGKVVVLGGLALSLVQDAGAPAAAQNTGSSGNATGFELALLLAPWLYRRATRRCRVRRNPRRR